MPKPIPIANKTISQSSPVFIIAEVGVNHNGDLETAMELVDQATDCGVDCIKFQTFKAERVVTPNAPKAKYQLDTTDQAESQLEMLKKIELDSEYHIRLKAVIEKRKLIFLSTPYNLEDVEFLELIRVPAYKIASGQIVEPPLLRAIAYTGKPIFLSTGMATLEEIGTALEIVRSTGNNDIILLQCTTNYPSRIEDANLRALNTFQRNFRTHIGYSDHTVGNVAAIAAVALGARVIEKHLTLDKSFSGPDHSSSMTPDELKYFVESIRHTELSLGSAKKAPTKAERKNTIGMRRSIVASRNIGKGEIINSHNITFKRPATGLAPTYYDEIIGKKATNNICLNEPLQTESVQWQED